MNCIKVVTLGFILILSSYVNATKPNLVLLPIDVSQQDVELEGQYGSALQEGLQKRYTVFYGAAVEKELEKEYSKIDCDAETCNQNVAIAFNGELIADSEVKKIDGGYLLKLVVRNVLTSEVIETKTVPCRGCDSFNVIEQLINMGSGTGKTAQTKVINLSSAPAIKSANTHERAILIFDTQPTGATIKVNGKLVGNSPYQGLNHKIGDRVRVKIIQQFYRPYEVTLDLQQAITQLEPIILEPGQSQVLIASQPFKKNSTVYVDGWAKGMAPLTVKLPAGKHSIQIKTKTESTAMKEIIINDGGNIEQLLSFASAEKQIRSNGSVRTISTNGLNIKMVKIPAGSFQMGNVNDHPYNRWAKPIHNVSIKAFSMSETEVTFASWDACVKAGGCSKYVARDEDWGRGNRPVINVSYKFITKQFIPWLNKVTDKQFRLPSEAEWEYAARAGSTTQYSWGNDISCSQARYSSDGGDCSGTSKTVEVKSYQSNNFGLYDMHGNVAEWTQDCWNSSYDGAPNNGEAWQEGVCNKHVVRGGAYSRYPYLLTSSYRSSSDRGNQHTGFRLVEDL